MVIVRAIQTCFVGNMLKHVGEEFDYDGEIAVGVMVALEDEAPVEKPKKSKVAKKKPKPEPPVGGEVIFGDD